MLFRVRWGIPCFVVLVVFALLIRLDAGRSGKNAVQYCCLHPQLPPLLPPPTTKKSATCSASLQSLWSIFFLLHASHLFNAQQLGQVSRQTRVTPVCYSTLLRAHSGNVSSTYRQRIANVSPTSSEENTSKYSVETMQTTTHNKRVLTKKR